MISKFVVLREVVLQLLAKAIFISSMISQAKSQDLLEHPNFGKLPLENQLVGLVLANSDSKNLVDCFAPPFVTSREMSEWDDRPNDWSMIISGLIDGKDEIQGCQKITNLPNVVRTFGSKNKFSMVFINENLLDQSAPLPGDIVRLTVAGERPRVLIWTGNYLFPHIKEMLSQNSEGKSLSTSLKKSFFRYEFHRKQLISTYPPRFTASLIKEISEDSKGLQFDSSKNKWLVSYVTPNRIPSLGGYYYPLNKWKTISSSSVKCEIFRFKLRILGFSREEENNLRDQLVAAIAMTRKSTRTIQQAKGRDFLQAIYCTKSVSETSQAKSHFSSLLNEFPKAIAMSSFKKGDEKPGKQRGHGAAYVNVRDRFTIHVNAELLRVPSEKGASAIFHEYIHCKQNALSEREYQLILPFEQHPSGLNSTEDIWGEAGLDVMTGKMSEPRLIPFVGRRTPNGKMFSFQLLKWDPYAAQSLFYFAGKSGL